MKQRHFSKRFGSDSQNLERTGRWRMKLAAILALACSHSFFLLTPLLGQQALSLQEAVHLALAQNPSVRASAAAENGAAERLVQARASYLPEVNYSESIQRGNNPVYVFGTLLEQHRFGSGNFALDSLNQPDALTNFSSQLTANQVVFDGNKTKHRLRSALLTRDMASEQSRRSEMDVLQAVTETYYGTVVAQENLQVAEEAFHTAQADLERSQALRDAGMTTDADVLALRVHLAEVEDQRIRSRNHLEVSRARLNDVLGVALDTQHLLTTPLRPVSLPAASLEQYENEALRERPEARQAEMAFRQAEADARLARAALMPEIVVHGAFAANRNSFTSRGGTNWMAGATLRLNLFRGFADRSRIAESSFLKVQREQEVRRTQSALRLQVRRFFLDLRAAGTRMEVAQTAIAEAEESHRILGNRYEAGLSDVTALLRSQTAVSAAKTRYLAAVYDQRVAAVRLERAAGSLGPSSEALAP